MSLLDVIALLGGLALFLYGMTVMGSGLEKMASGKLEQILRKLTSSVAKGALLGAVVTAIIQSSSGTTVIVIGLVNSGIMKFSQAIGVIMGANVGTTVTGQIIRLADVSGDSLLIQLVKPSTLAPLAALVGAVMYLFLKKARTKNLGQILVGFGILFSGMFAMEEAVRPLSESPFFANIFAGLSNPFLGVLAGALITAVIQSSSASVGILQALSITGLVTWGNAIPIILGQNIGTTATALLASIGASRAARRVAFSHLYFNIIGTLLVLPAVYGFKAIAGAPFWNESVGMGGIANFHTVFNVVMTLFFLPFNGVLVWLAYKSSPDIGGKPDHPELSPMMLDERLYAGPSVAVAQARGAVCQMTDLATLLTRDALDTMLGNNAEATLLAQQREETLDKLDVSVTNYLIGITRLELDEAEGRETTRLLLFVNEFERIGDHATNIGERAGEIFDKGLSFSAGALSEIRILNNAVVEALTLVRGAFVDGDITMAARVEPLEETVDDLCDILRERHIMRLKLGRCSIESGVVFLEALTNYERISDHCSNIAARLLVDVAGTASPDQHALLRELHESVQGQYLDDLERYREKYKLSDMLTSDISAPKITTRRARVNERDARGKRSEIVARGGERDKSGDRGE